MQKEDPEDIRQEYRYEIGSDYFYELPMGNEMVSLEGKVVLVAGDIVVVRVENMNVNMKSYTLTCDEIYEYFPDVKNEEQAGNTQYFCVNTNLDVPVFDRDSVSWKLSMLACDSDGHFEGYIPADNKLFCRQVLRNVLSRGIQDTVTEQSVQLPKRTINIELSKAEIESLSPFGNENTCVYHYSVFRAINWFTECDCALVTAWRQENNRKTNDSLNDQLQIRLRELGYGVIKVKGCYLNKDNFYEKENSFLVVDLRCDSKFFFNNIYKLSEKYGQDCFIYKEKGNGNPAFCIGTNDKYGKDSVDVIGVLRIVESDATAYTRIGSGRISFG